MKLVLITAVLASSLYSVRGIINGQDAIKAPYQASIQVNGSHLCGGVIIHTRFVSIFIALHLKCESIITLITFVCRF